MGGGGTETTTQTSGPTNPQVDKTTTQLLKGLQGQVDKGTAVFGKDLYAGLSSTTQGGLKDLNRAAQAGAGGLNDAYNWAQGMVDSGGYGTGQKGAMATTNGLTGRYGEIAGSLSGPSAAQKSYSGMASTAGNPSLSESVLMNIAKGGAFGTKDPGYARLKANLGDDTMSGINEAFNASGRFGGGSNVESATEGLGNVYAGLDYQNFQNDQQRQMSALSAIEGQRQQGFQNKFNATGAADSARLAQLGAQMGALGQQGQSASTAFGMGQQGVANAGAAAAAMPGLYDATLRPAQTQLGIGQLYDAHNQARLLAENDLFRRQNDAGWDTLGRASSILAGTAGAGTQQQSNTTPTAPWWQQALGYVAGNAGKAIGMM